MGNFQLNTWQDVGNWPGQITVNKCKFKRRVSWERDRVGQFIQVVYASKQGQHFTIHELPLNGSYQHWKRYGMQFHYKESSRGTPYDFCIDEYGNAKPNEFEDPKLPKDRNTPLKRLATERQALIKKLAQEFVNKLKK